MEIYNAVMVILIIAMKTSMLFKLSQWLGVWFVIKGIEVTVTVRTRMEMFRILNINNSF
jgi:hypothetical protein